jgi:hypothetical protein
LRQISVCKASHAEPEFLNALTRFHSERLRGNGVTEEESKNPESAYRTNTASGSFSVALGSIELIPDPLSSGAHKVSVNAALPSRGKTATSPGTRSH